MSEQVFAPNVVRTNKMCCFMCGGDPNRAVKQGKFYVRVCNKCYKAHDWTKIQLTENDVRKTYLYHKMGFPTPSKDTLDFIRQQKSMIQEKERAMTSVSPVKTEAIQTT